jgi:transcriptional regulator with XRE-family HTH domain
MAVENELAGLLRAWRNRLSPAAVGLPVGERRTKGLRREELAMLAGLSVDYVVRLEQGRSARPSEQVASSLARVLQLSPLERDQLFLAAGLPVPLSTSAPNLIPASVQRLLIRLPDVAIGVYSAHWNLLSTNDAWTALLGRAPHGYNLIVAQFTGTAPQVVTTREHLALFERALVSDLRVAALRYPADPSVHAIRKQLASNERFAALWAEAALTEHLAEAKTFTHPLVGDITVDCDIFTVPGSDLHIVTYTAAPGTEDASRFDLVRTLGPRDAFAEAPS